MKYLNYLLIILCISFVSCDDWLDIQPKSETGQEDLFSEAQGFRNSLYGVYMKATNPNLYGRRLTWGLIDAVAQYLDPVSITSLKKAGEYDYKYKNVESKINNIWNDGYNIILNCNELIDNIKDSEASGFLENEKDMILGEALAMRAMMHFDILRCFADRYSESKDELAIPYIKHKTLNPVERSKGSEVIQNIKDDLVQAGKYLIKVDTVEEMRIYMSRLYQRFGTATKKLEFSHRGYRLNYYASLALLARVNLYAGEKKEAYDLANEVKSYEAYGSPIFEFSSEGDVSKSLDRRDVKLRGGIIGGLHYELLTKEYDDYTSESNYYHIYIKNAETIFEDSKSDYRFKYILDKTASGNYYNLKYRSSGDTYVERDERPLIPLFRLSEMYYIMCEYLIDTNPNDAIELLNELRIARGITDQLPKTLSKEEFMEELVKDARKEFIGEGQMFFMYKRLNHGIKTGTQFIEPEEIAFTFPYPISETNL